MAKLFQKFSGILLTLSDKKIYGELCHKTGGARLLLKLYVTILKILFRLHSTHGFGTHFRTFELGLRWVTLDSIEFYWVPFL